MDISTRFFTKSYTTIIKQNKENRNMTISKFEVLECSQVDLNFFLMRVDKGMTFRLEFETLEEWREQADRFFQIAEEQGNENPVVEIDPDDYPDIE